MSEEHVFEGYAKIAPKANNNGTHRFHAFRWSRDKVERESHDLKFEERGDGFRVYTKVRDVDSTAVKDLVMDISTNHGKKGLEAAGVDPAWFDYPKPISLIQFLCEFATEKDSLVMDFFAGSGSTAHAVAQQNAVDGGNRRCISINLPEPVDIDSAAARAGIQTVSEITLRRIVGFMSAIDGASDQGLRVYRLAPSLFRGEKDLDPDSLFDMSDQTLLDSNSDLEHIAAEILLMEGVRLDSAIYRKSAGSASLLLAAGVAVVQSLDISDEIVDAILDLEPRVAVFLEDGFVGKDETKANADVRTRDAGIIMKTI